MSWLNVGEVAGQLEPRHGADEAALVVRRLRTAVALDDVTPERVLQAASIKALHPIASADCFAAATAAAAAAAAATATAAARGATLMTADRELLEREIGCRVRDLRPR